MALRAAGSETGFVLFTRLSLAGLDHMYRAPWLAIWPAVALSLAVFGFNMLGDALRDLLDPRLKGRVRIPRAAESLSL